MGIQFFGRMDYRCVIPGTDPHNVTVNDLAIPDTMCTKKGGGGYECPDNMECMKLDMSGKAEGFYGMFDDFGHSIFTVYLAASEEGWVYVLYDCIDSLPSHVAFLYFVTLIFFLAWLVKNVFIAVITETFAEIRVQFSEMWQKKEVTLDDDFKQRIEKTDEGWKLIKLDTDPKHLSPRIKTLQMVLRSTAFQCVIVGLVFANAVINGSFVYKHDGTDPRRRKIYYYIECGFTLLFNIESAAKIICYGFRAYWKRNIFKFEFLLCVGSTLNTIKYFYDRNIFTYFQCFRLFRLIKASPMLEDFVYKVIFKNLNFKLNIFLADFLTREEIGWSRDIHCIDGNYCFRNVFAIILLCSKFALLPNIPSGIHGNVPNCYSRRMDGLCCGCSKIS